MPVDLTYDTHPFRCHMCTFARYPDACAAGRGSSSAALPVLFSLGVFPPLIFMLHGLVS